MDYSEGMTVRRNWQHPESSQWRLLLVCFLAGGTANVFMLPAPVWFSVVDLVGAYLPMAWIGAMLASKGK